MSIALERMETSGFGRVMKCACDASRFESAAAKEEDDDWRSSTSSTTSSSIGRNSDDVSGRSSSEEDDDNEYEVQSSYKGKGGLDMMNDLEQVLPIRRGISSFYNGKSKSFTSLAEASSTESIKDIAKPENAYTRRRRNLLAINHIWDNYNYKTRNSNRNNKRGLIRPISSSKSTLALAVAMSSSESISSAGTADDSTSTSTSSPRLPPLHPQTRTFFNNVNTNPSPLTTGRNLSSWRSFSLADVREYSAVMGSGNLDCPLIHDKN